MCVFNAKEFLCARAGLCLSSLPDMFSTSGTLSDGMHVHIFSHMMLETGQAVSDNRRS
jgi:hypothetical protein